MNYEHLHHLHLGHFHDATFDALYACIAIATFVIIERGLYLGYLSLRAARISRLIGPDARSGGVNPLSELAAADPISAAMRRYAALQGAANISRNQLEDYSSSLFIELDTKISARLWVLDTIITAAPLLGLLGTILGIIETFTALAQGGVSDPGEVSRGIGVALLATAIGIATALLGLLGHNILNRCAHLLTEDVKTFMLRLTAGPANVP